MALAAGSKNVNILKSLNTYVHTNLVTTDGVDVHFPGQRSVFVPSGATWVQLNFLLGLSRLFMGEVGNSSERGNIVTGTISLNCCEFVDQRSGISYALPTLRDAVRARVTEGTAIIIRDYDTVGDPGAGHFVVLNTDDNDVQDGFSPEDGGIAILNISASGEYVEAFT